MAQCAVSRERFKHRFHVDRPSHWLSLTLGWLSVSVARPCTPLGVEPSITVRIGTATPQAAIGGTYYTSSIVPCCGHH